MDLDTNWCPVCERLIAPERITLPSASEVATKPTTTSVPKPKSGTVRASQARRSTASHSRSGNKPSAAAHKRTGTDLLPTQASNSAPPGKLRTVISQAPSALYCSDSCREKDQLSSERFQLSLENLYLDPSSASSLSSPLFVSGSESDADGDHLTNESYFAQLRIHGKTPRQTNRPEANSWTDRRLSGGTTTASSSEDLPAASSPGSTRPGPSAPTSSNARPSSSSHQDRSRSAYDGNAALYAAYPLTFHRTRTGEGSARSRKNSYSSLCETGIESADAHAASKPTDIQSQTLAADVTPTQSLCGINDVSAQGLLVRPALLRAKSERLNVSPLSPIAPVSDSAPRLYSPQLLGSKFGFTPVSTPASPTGPRNTFRQPAKELSKYRRRSEGLSKGVLTEASRTRSCDQIPTQKSPFMPMYPALMTTPSTRVVRKWVLERGADGVERLVEGGMVEEPHEERERLFHFNTEDR